MKNFIQTLRDRGMFHTMIPGTEAQLAQEKTLAYIGFDPTASSLHIGNLAPIMLLKQFELAGHRPVVLLGGATGMIGDPSFKAAERPLLNEETLVHHQECLQKQLKKFLDFSSKKGALLVNNYTWFKEISALSFLRKVGKHISINYMMGKESVKNRLETGISYTEFAYQLLQAYDFYYLYTRHGIKMQMGGADQWGNITTGTTLIRKKAQATAFGVTTPLITKADGTKFGKTESGNVWLNSELTSPYAFYQFFLNCSDEDTAVLLKCLTLYPMEEIAELLHTHEQAPHKRVLQTALAKFLTVFVHSEDAHRQAVKASSILFGETPREALASLGEKTLLECLAGVPHITIKAFEFVEAQSLTDLLTHITQYKIFQGRRVAREMIEAGGIRLNKCKVREPNLLPVLPWIHGKYLLVQKGKKQTFLIIRAA